MSVHEFNPPGAPTKDELIRRLREVNARQAEQIVRLGNSLKAAHRREARLRELLDEAGVMP